MRIVLASQSPRRKKLLKQLQLDFEAIPSHEAENSTQREPALMVQELAKNKALSVAENETDALIIGADTIVVFDGKILGKPNDKARAVAMLQLLSGSTHTVFTGVALVLKKGKEVIDSRYFYEETKVTFGTLTRNEIEAYVATNSPMDKAGAYGIQDDLGSLFVERINGDYNTVIGLPLYRLYNELKTFAPEVLT